jgi:hypothetical protein
MSVAPEFNRISAIQDILDANLNVGSDAKVKLSNDIKQLFETSAVCLVKKEQIKNIEYDPKDLRITKANVKSLETSLVAVEKGENLEALAKKYGVDATQDAIKGTITTLLAAENKTLSEVSAKQAIKKALEEELTKARQAFDKEAKDKYSTWKKTSIADFEAKKKQLKEQLKTHAKDSTEYVRLESEISRMDVFAHLSSSTEDVYSKLRLARDEISHKSIRSSKTKLTARELIKHAAKRFSGAAYDNFQRRVNQVTRANLEQEEDKKIPDVVRASDFIGSSLSTQGSTPFDLLFQTDLFTQLCTEATHQAAYDKLVEQSSLYSDQHEHYLEWATKYLKFSYNNGFDTSAIVVLSGLLVDLVMRYAKCLQSALKYHSNLQTINVGLIHSLYEGLFILRGVDYEETRERVNTLWANKLKDE